MPGTHQRDLEAYYPIGGWYTLGYYIGKPNLIREVYG